MRILSSLLSVGLLLFTLGCDAKKRQGEVTLRNDIQDRTFNVITVDEVSAVSGGVGFKASLDPGDEITLPASGVRSFRVSREYRDFTRVYVVACPEKKGAAVIKLIDIHLNRLPSGCRLSKVGEMRDGFVRWQG